MSLRVDWRSSLSLGGTVIKWLTVPLVFPFAIALYDGRDQYVFAVTMVTAAILGFFLERLKPDPRLGLREGFLTVGASWLMVAAVGSVPYVLAGNGSVAHPINAFFESMSGFTTTGSTVMKQISLNTHSSALMMWRQLTQWLGGMGIIVLAVAILPKLSIGGSQLMEAEAPGPQVERLAPRIVETARRLWGLYIGLTVLEICCLYGLYGIGWAPGMNLYQSVAHALTTLPTGGFSPAARSIEAFSAAVQWTIIPFMLMAGTSFALMWRAITGHPDSLFEDREFQVYLVVLTILSLLLTVILLVHNNVSGLEEGLRHGLFQTLTIITTTGYASADFNLWSGLATTLLFLAMFVGGCAGSTGGGIKIIRWIVGVKANLRELFSTIHPRAVRPIRIGKQVLDNRTVRQITAMILFYFLLVLVSTALIEADVVQAGMDTQALDVLSSVAACLGNIGPGFGMVGPMNNFLSYPPFSKILLAGLMWVGRLEIFTVLVLFLPTYWKL